MDKFFPIKQELIERKAPPIRRNIDYMSMPRKTFLFTEEEIENMNQTYDNLFGYGDDLSDSFEVPVIVKPMSNINMEDSYRYKLDCSDPYEKVPNRKANFYDSLYKKYYKTDKNPTNYELLDFLYDKPRFSIKKEYTKEVASNEILFDLKKEPGDIDQLINKLEKLDYPFAKELFEALIKISSQDTKKEGKKSHCGDKQVKVKRMQSTYIVPNFIKTDVLKPFLVDGMDLEERLADFDAKVKALSKSDKELALEELTNCLYLYLSKPKPLSALKMLLKVLNLKDKVVSKLKKIYFFRFQCFK